MGDREARKVAGEGSHNNASTLQGKKKEFEIEKDLVASCSFHLQFLNCRFGALRSKLCSATNYRKAIRNQYVPRNL